MTGLILQTIRVVVDPRLWEMLLFIAWAAVALGLVYFLYIYVVYRMAKARRRDPLGWVLLSFCISPLLTWIILFIVGDNIDTD